MTLKSRMLAFGLALLFLCWTLPDLAAQDSPNVRFGVEAAPFISFAGLNFNLAATAQMGKHEFYLGPKWVLSDTYLIERGPWGIDLGYRWNLAPDQKLRGFFNIEYQTAFLRPAGNGLKTTIQELHGGYGFQLAMGDHWNLGNSIGLGGVRKQSRVAGSEETYGLTGFSFLLKFFVNYQFGK